MVLLGRRLRPSRMVVVVVAPRAGDSAASAGFRERGAMGVDGEGKPLHRQRCGWRQSRGCGSASVESGQFTGWFGFATEQGRRQDGAGRSRTEQDGALAFAANRRLWWDVSSRCIRTCPPPEAISIPRSRHPSSTRNRSNLVGWKVRPSRATMPIGVRRMEQMPQSRCCVPR